MNDPRGILEEFVDVAHRHRTWKVVRFDGVNQNMEPEHLRADYRKRHERIGLCRSCKRDAKPGRKYCLVHLARANERAVRSIRARAGST